MLIYNECHRNEQEKGVNGVSGRRRISIVKRVGFSAKFHGEGKRRVVCKTQSFSLCGVYVGLVSGSNGTSWLHCVSDHIAVLSSLSLPLPLMANK
jgi:exonuclease III